jgi:predicted transcriptional regulator of viral defense system
VDALARPDLCAGFETVVGCWVNAKNADTDWGGVCEIARRQGPSMMRRVIFLLRLIGFDAVGQRAFPDLRGRGLSTLLDRSSSFQLPERGRVRDRTTGIVVNVPPEYLLAWTGATSLM